MAKGRLRDCVKCDEEFTHPRLDTKYCEKCRDKTRFKRKLVPVKDCLHCGEEYQPVSLAQKFCSRECQRMEYKKNNAKVSKYTPEERRVLQNNKINEAFIKKTGEGATREEINSAIKKYLKKGRKITILEHSPDEFPEEEELFVSPQKTLLTDFMEGQNYERFTF